jgi:HD-like signal output (HDOD) protein
VKRALFVDDEPRILDGLRRMLRPLRDAWDFDFASGGADAIARLDESSFDVIVSDMRMPGIDGAALLRHCQRHHPDIVRIVLSGHMEMENARQSVPVAHQFLGKPCDADALRRMLTRTADLRDLLADPSLRAALGEIHRVPVLPETHRELAAAVADPSAGVANVAAIVEKHPALAAKVMQLVNSAFLGVARPVSNLTAAIGVIGTNMLRSLVLHLDVLRVLEDERPGVREEVERHAHHAMRVARLARGLSTGARARDDAFTAGLLHDLGELFLEVRRSELGEQIRARSAGEHRARVEVEREMLGVTHAEIGAYLLGVWGLPHDVVESVAHHHRPDRLHDARPDDLALVVHAAEVLQQAFEDGAQAHRGELNDLAAIFGADTLAVWQDRADAILQEEEIARAP